MASLEARRAQFLTKGFPDEEVPVEALCRDNRGTFVLPYPCCRFDDEWRNFLTDETILATVIGWRLFEERAVYRPRRHQT